MNHAARRHRVSLGAGAVLLLCGGITLGMVPASATLHKSASVPLPPAVRISRGAETPAVRSTTTTESTTTTTLPQAGSPVAGGLVPCPAGDPGTDTCAAMPCPSGIYCGTVVAGPTQDLGADQFVYLNFSGFEPGDGGIEVYYCADPGAASTLAPANPAAAPPTCTIAIPQAPQAVHIYPNSSSQSLPQGTAESTFETAEVSAPSNPLEGEQHDTTDRQPSTFYCDGTTANPCSFVITDESIDDLGPASTSLNSVEIPITFAPATSGCPNGSVVNTESEFGIDLLMPEVARLSCAANPSTAVIPDETAIDGLQAVTDLASGQTQIAFTDDPEAPDQQAQLAGGGYTYIPVALSASVVGFYAQFHGLSGLIPQDQMELTPTMAAGLLTGYSGYSGGEQFVDDVDPCSGPSEAAGGGCLGGPPNYEAPCYGNAGCSLYLQQNFVLGYNQFQSFQSFQRSDSAGVTDQLFGWLCNAPIVQLDFGTFPKESRSGAQLLEAGLSPQSGPPLTTCPDTDQVPAVTGNPLFTTVNDPSQQALKGYNAVVGNPSDINPTASFADMNWAEAAYYGMSVAGLQNAAGNFELPTQASLDAALSGAKANPDGTLTTVNSSSDPTAYPMTSVIYAVVPTAPMEPDAATAVTDLLHQLLDLTGNGGSENADLPQGFVPLPAALTSQAASDVANDINVETVPTPPGSSPAPTPSGSTTVTTSPPSGSTSTSTSTSATGAPSLPIANFASGASDFLSDYGAASVGGILSQITPAGGAVLPLIKRLALLGPDLPGYALVGSHGRFLVPVALIGGLGTIALGLMLMTSGFVSRRKLLRTSSAGANGEPDSDPGVAR